jgi:zinc protease
MTLAYPTTPPEGGLPQPWDFPEMAQTQLRSGLKVAAIRMPALPIVQVRWSFRGGRQHEPVADTGASRLLQSVMRHGTASYDSAELAEALDQVGARMHVSISADNAMVSVSALANHLDIALALSHEVAFTPTFPEAAVERERAKAVEVHRHDRAQADTLAGLWLAWVLYGDHPYGRPSTTEAGLRSVNTDMLRSLHREMTHPGIGLLLVVGDVDPDAVVARLSDRYSGFRVDEAAPTVPEVAAPQATQRRAILVERPGAQQASIVLGTLALSRRDPDYLPLRLANQVFGGGASSRLFMELRERQSLTYGAYSALDCGVLAGDLTAGLSCANDKAVAAVSALWAELQRMADGTIDPMDLSHARRYLVGSFPQRASGIAGVAALANAGWLHGLPNDIWSNYQADVAAVAQDRVVAASRRWFRPESSALVVAGEASVLDALQPDLERSDTPVHRCGMQDTGFELDAHR